MAREFDLSAVIVAGLVISAVLACSGCMDENSIDSTSDEMLADMTDDEFTDADETMDVTLFKMAEDASGTHVPEIVAEYVQVEALEDGSIAPYDPENLPENLPKEVALDAYMHPENYFSISKLSNGNLKIDGLRELDGWKVTRSYHGVTYDDMTYDITYNPKPFDIRETNLNNDVFGDVVMKTQFSEEKGNPSGNEITAVLVKDPDGRVMVYILLSPEWTNEENYRVVHSAFPDQNIVIPWKLEECFDSDSCRCRRLYEPYLTTKGHEGLYKPPLITIGDVKIPYIIQDLTYFDENLDKRQIEYHPSTIGHGSSEVHGDIIYYGKNIPGIVIEKSS